MPNQDLLIGIDVGTSVVKAVAFDFHGRTVSLARRANAFSIPHSGWAECDMLQVWQLVCETLRELTGQGLARRVRGIGISGNMGGAWLADAAGRPVRAAILWNDGRAAEIVNRWRNEGLLEEIFSISCNAPVPGFTVPVLRWLKEREPDTMRRADCLLFSKDWVRFKLTGERCTEETDASHIPGDVRTRQYSQQVLELCGVADEARLLPPLVDSAGIAWYVHARAAEETGLAEGTPVVAGLADVSASLLGAGALPPGCATAIAGTSCLNSVTTAEPVFEPCGVGVSFLLPGGRWTRSLPNQTGTLALDWFAREFMPLSHAELEAAAAAVPMGARGVIFHPYLNSTGVVAPVYEPRARGRFWGIGMEHTREDLLRAVYEGVALSMADCFQHLPRFDLPVRLIGGASRSRFWRQLFADVTGYPMALMDGEEPGALGVAMMAGVAVGVWDSLEEAVGVCCRIRDHVGPDRERHERYAAMLPLYQKLRSDLSGECDLRS